jgi:hypothetical protein
MLMDMCGHVIFGTNKGISARRMFDFEEKALSASPERSKQLVASHCCQTTVFKQSTEARVT